MVVQHCQNEKYYSRLGGEAPKLHEFLGSKTSQSQQPRLFPYDVANGINTIEVLKQIRAEFPAQTMTTIWDGAPYHRSHLVKDEAKSLNINLQPLSAYSPDFMPALTSLAMVQGRSDLSHLLSESGRVDSTSRAVSTTP